MDNVTVNTAIKRERKKPPHLFKKGQSGNPKGKPKGAKHKSTIAALELLNGESEALTRCAINKALEGDMAALKLCIERIVPVSKSLPLSVSLPSLKDGNISTFSEAIIRKVSSGCLLPDEATALSSLLQGHIKAIEITEMQDRIKALEEAQEKKHGKSNNY